MPRALHDLKSMLHSIALQVYRQHESFAMQVKQFIEIEAKYMHLVDFLQCLEESLKGIMPKNAAMLYLYCHFIGICEYLKAVNVAD